jgi:predicted lipoprotein with Yx(FWY)xxD motif
MKRSLLVIVLPVVVLAVAAWLNFFGNVGSTANLTPKASSSTPMTTMPLYATTATTATPAPTPSMSGSMALIHTATVMVNGKAETVLTDAQGRTLYYFANDTRTMSACTGGCASAWPPLLAPGASISPGGAALPYMLSIQKTDNGNQVEYHGHLLYTYSEDGAPGQASGQGLGNAWFVATPNI